MSHKISSGYNHLIAAQCSAYVIKACTINRIFLRRQSGNLTRFQKTISRLRWSPFRCAKESASRSKNSAIPGISRLQLSLRLNPHPLAFWRMSQDMGWGGKRWRPAKYYPLHNHLGDVSFEVCLSVNLGRVQNLVSKKLVSVCGFSVVKNLFWIDIFINDTWWIL